MIELVFNILKDIQPGRMIESFLFLGVCMWKLKPVLKRVDDRMVSLEKTLKAAVKEVSDNVTMGFSQGNARFTRIETRLDLLENKPKNVSGVSDDAKTH
jgi:hypothetical protein